MIIHLYHFLFWFLRLKYLELLHELLTDIKFTNSFFQAKETFFPKGIVYHLYNAFSPQFY